MINSISLANWKNHKNLQLNFKNGTNVLVGSMGSGKSSILQAISFALFGSFTELKSRQITQSDLITRGVGAQRAEIQMQVSSKGQNYLIKRQVDSKSNSEASVIGADKILAGPNPTAANEFVKTLLGVDEDVFLRTVYARQNDIDLVLKFTPKERKKRIDELMGLDKFEIGRNNCVTLRNKISRSIKETQQFLFGFQEEKITETFEAVLKEFEALKTKKIVLETDITKKTVEVNNLKDSLAGLRKQFEEVNRLEERRKSVERQVREVQSQLQGKDLSRSKISLENEILKLKGKVGEITGEKRSINDNLSKLRENILKYERRTSGLEEKNRDLKNKLEKIEHLKRDISKHNISDLNAELISIRKKVEGKKEVNQENLVELRSLRKHLSDLEAAGSTCPVCSKELAELTKEELISRRKSEITKLIERSTGVSEKLAELESRKRELEDIFDENRLILEDVEKEEQILREYKENHQEFENLKKLLETENRTISSNEDKLRRIDSEIEDKRNTIEIFNADKHLYDIKDKEKQLADEFYKITKEFEAKKIDRVKVSETDEQFQRGLQALQEMQTTVKSYDSLLREKTARLEELKVQQKKIDELTAKVKDQERKIIFLDKLKTGLEATQLTLRDEFILAVNEVMTAVWLEIYPYEKWSGVRLLATEEDYHLQLKERDRDWIGVAGFASGGERMLASLAVRIAFARVLAPNLSLLILDEPTHNLDENAIKTLIEVIETRVTDFLDQIFIVTHEEKLAESADNVIRL